MGAPDAAGASKVGRRRVAWLAAGLCAAIVGLSPGSAAAQSLPAPLLAIDFDRLAEGALPRGVSITTQFRAPDVVPGVIGSAWRTDGFSSHAQADLALDAHQGYTISLWLALESFPSDLEVPVAELSPSSIAQQAANGAGFDLHIDTYGRWGFRVATAAGELNAAAPKTFPLRRWTHVVASVDPASGAVDLYQDGARVASAHGAAPLTLKLAQAPLQLATPPRLAKILQFTINRLNAAYDLVAVYPGALTPAQLALLPGPAASQVPSADRSLVVPESRFAGDFLRPRVHPMPPANWTNEPHGFVRFGDAWHLFYQRTPNGPYKTQMHWGHLTSRDLVHWESLPDALWPELQTDRFGFDMKGIWSGNVIVDGGKAYAFYTSVNHGDRLAASNPGISMAVSDDPQLIHWRKLGPILNTEAVKDFRDPFLWQEGDSWHMLIGAALATGGGLEYLVLKPGEKGARWEVQRRFSELAYPIMDPASVIWEMPVFEQLSDRTSILVVNPIGGKVSKYGDPATRAVYWTGEWSGGLFKPYFRDPKNLDLLPGHLAPTVARAADGTLRAIGIVDERRTPLSQERAGWANALGLPRVWTLLPDGRTLGQAPAPELRALRGEQRIARDAMPLGREPITVAHEGHAYELLVDLGARAAEPAPIRIDVLAAADGSEYTRLIFDQARQRVVVDKSHASRAPNDEGPQVLQGDYDSAAFGPMRQLHVFVDGSVVEVYINDAAAYAVRSYPSLATSTQLRLSTDGTSPTPVKMQLWPLRDPAGSQRQAITAAAKETQP
ncbi:MAG: GH32 C-terminal domain-containing protein [Burkholderiales bacterium]|nr:GH32 C-terminal domain-containing protein [Burkholderiales bacterium]